MTPAPDLTRWNRSGLSRFHYTRGEAAEWLELIRVHLLLISAMQEGTPQGIELDPDAYVEAMARGEEIAGLPVDEALTAIGARWRFLEAPETEEGFRRARPARTYRDAVAARYAHIGTDQTAQIARAFARAVHVLTRTVDAYAQEGLLGSVTQPDHLRLLVEMTGLTPTPAASATMPVALVLKPGTAPQTIAAGLAVEPRVKGEDAPLTFESLDPVLAAPALNVIEPADRFVATIHRIAPGSDFLTIRTGQPLTGDVGDGRGLALSADGGEARVVRVLARSGRTVLIWTSADDLESIAPTRLALRHGLRLLPRRTGSGWLPLAEDHGLTVGTAVIATAGGSTVALRVAAVEGRDVRLEDASGTISDATRDTITAVRPAIRSSMIPTMTDGAYNTVSSFSLSVSRNQLEAVQAISSATDVPVATSAVGQANRVVFELDAVPQGLAADTFALAELRPSGIVRVRITNVSIVGGLLAIDIDGATPTDVRALRAGFEVTADVAFETPSSGPLVSGGQIGTALSVDDVPPDAAGRKRLMLAMADDAPVVFEATLEADGTIVPVEPMPDALVSLTRGECTIHGNVVTFGHGKSQPATPLGSGDGTEDGQVFTFAKGPLATRMAPDEDGGVAPDVAITVSGRAYRRVTSLDGLDPEDDAVYLANVTFDGATRFRFPYRLPSAPDNVMLTRVRLGAGAKGNMVAPFAVQKLSKADGRIERIVQPLAAQFGRDMPTVDAIRADSRRGLTELTHLVTAEDYARHTERHTAVWHARADAVIRAADGGRVTMRLVVVPAGGGAITQLREPLRQHLLKKAAPGVKVTIERFVPVPLRVDATVTLVPGYGASPELEAELSTLLVDQYGLRQRPLGEEFFVSGLVAALERHPAVNRVALEVALVSADPAAAPFRERRNAGGVLQALVLRRDQSAFLDPERLTVTLDTGGA